MPADYSLALIVCSRDRAEQLARCLASMERLRCAAQWSLVVVDNGSRDNTREIVLQCARNFPVELKYVFERKPGLGNAHNAAVRIAQAGILAFTDDDCYPDENYLERILECFAEDERLGFVGGRILLHDPSDAPITIQTMEERVEIPPRTFIPAGLIQGANFACRREAVMSVGGFDPWFGPGAYFNAEEVDLLARLSAANWYGVYDPRPLVYHHHGRKPGQLAGLLHSYDRGRGAYYTKSLLNPRLTRAYLWKWMQSMRRSSRLQSYREVSAGLEYLCRAALDFGRRFR